MTRLPTCIPARIDYRRLAAAAVPHLSHLLPRWLPDGRRSGPEWVALNPTRDDSTLGSFKINMFTGRWADFATGDKGGDVISLLAYVHGTSQGQAARMLMQELEVQ